jgi:hypothetical protein
MAGQKITLKRVRLSFPRFDRPEAFEGGTPKFKGTFIIEDAEQIKAVKAAVIAVGKEQWGEKFAPLLRKGKLSNPIKTSDEDTPGYPEGSVYVRASSKDQPGMVAVWKGRDGKAARVDADQFYAGCYVNVSLFCSSFDMPANKGVTFYLNNVQFAADGERLDNRIAAEDEFEVDEDATAPLDDLDESEDANEDDEDEDEDEDEAPAPKKSKKAKAAKEDDLTDLM